ncbi:hypothetical protein OMR58_22215 [Erwinia sp. INIA-01]|uniref:hypothetical protein n=1 Tax=Erwinia sp. INIA01 TaxID=2991500 RepID=UPI002223FAE1|nr:hypothetical protein [Erwinia sp. INIA01]MCW1877166.1 hypothetical protein [Erwinia sp. INIA01]
MNITYSEVKSDSAKIVESILSSDREIPSLKRIVGVLKYHIALYVFFATLSFFLPKVDKGSGVFFLVAAFGVMHWFLLVSLMSSYATLFFMVRDTKVKELKLMVLVRSKIKSYSMVWAFGIVLLGLISISTELNIGALVFGNLIISVLGLIIFNLDMSRFQISSLLGAISAAKDSFSKRS